MTFTQDHGCGIDLQKFACWQDKVRTTQTITTKLVNYIRLVTLITWLDVEGIMLKTFLPNFPIFFKVKHSIGHISGMVCPIDLKQKGVASIGYWVSYMTSTFTSHMTLTFDFSRSNFKIALSQELSDRCEKATQLDTGLTVWACLLTTPIHDVHLVASRSKFEIALFEEWGVWLTWNWRDVSRSFMTMTIAYR